jgi:hypothetical protein
MLGEGGKIEGGMDHLLGGSTRISRMELKWREGNMHKFVGNTQMFGGIFAFAQQNGWFIRF